MVAPGVARGAPSVRGFSDGTITVAGIGIAAQFDPGASIGAQARFKRANDDKEVKGITIDYKEFADDQQDPAKSLTESRRLVTQVGVFAIVPDLSDTNAGAYLNQQHVPYFGWAFDDTYCSPTPIDRAVRVRVQRLPGARQARSGCRASARTSCTTS